MNSLTRFNNMRIRNKLVTVILLVAIPVLLLSSVTHIILEVKNYLTDLRQSVASVAHVIAHNNQAAIVFDDKAASMDTLKALQSMPYITTGFILDANEDIFAVYDKSGDFSTESKSKIADLTGRFRADQFEKHQDYKWFLDSEGMAVSVAIELDGELIGHMFIVTDLSLVTEALTRTAAVTGVILLISLMLVFWLSRLLQQLISRPIVRLTHSMRSISASANYDIRLEKTTDDELGRLYDVFNQMLEELKERDIKLTEYREDLEQKVSDRTFALKAANVELSKARDLAEQANKAKSDFVATMSHEIRTPLNGILGMAELLGATELSKRQQHFVEVMEESGKNLLVVINDILDFSKIEAGKLELDYTYFNLRHLVEELAFAFSHQTAEKDIEMIVDVPPELDIDIYADSYRLRQILFNLVGNAAKFTEEGQIVIRVRTYDAVGKVLRVAIEVEDSGVGIEAEKIEKIQEAFSQADGSTTRQFGGTGLGLAIVKRLLNLMRSDLVIKSAQGEGSCFSFEMLTYHREAVDTSEKDQVKDLSGVKVLLVDDNPVNREVLSHQVESWGMQYNCVANAQLAIDHLKTTEVEGKPAYELALIDYHMPEMNGLELARTLRKRYPADDIKLIALSSAAESRGVVFRDAGLDARIEKPARRDELLGTMTRLLSRKDAAPAESEGLHSRPAEWQQVGAKVLLVEDTLVNQEIGKTFLEMYGCQVDVAENGEECMNLFETEKYDMILMDCLMPVMDGFAATSEIRRIESEHKAVVGFKRTPIVALTANAMDGFDKECIAAGMDDYLAKPFSSEGLLNMLKKWAPDYFTKP